MRCSKLAVAIAVFMFLGAPAWAGESKDFAPKNGMFTVTMPAGEHAAPKRILTIGGNKIAVEAFESKVDNGTLFVGASIGIPAKVMRDIPADERLDTIGDAIAKSLDGKAGDKKDITQDGVPGREFQIETKDGAIRVQLYAIRGWVMYAFVQGKTKDDVSNKDSDAFFDSFKLSDKAKELFGRTRQ